MFEHLSQIHNKVKELQSLLKSEDGLSLEQEATNKPKYLSIAFDCFTDLVFYKFFKFIFHILSQLSKTITIC